MAAIEETKVDETTSTPVFSNSQVWLHDADEIESLMGMLKSRTAKMHVRSLVDKIRIEAAAFEAVEKVSGPIAPAKPARTPAPMPKTKPVPLAKPIAVAPMTPSSVTYQSIDKFAFDGGSINDKFVTLYIPIPGVGSVPDKKEQITCDFKSASFDLIVRNLNGKSYRLIKDKLEHDIIPEKSKYIVKADKIVVKLHKLETDVGGVFSTWTKLTDPKWKEKKNSKADPTQGFKDMMKDLYESGDENMKKLIGESMVRHKSGEVDLKTVGSQSKWSNLGGFGSGNEPTPETAAATQAANDAYDAAAKAKAEAEAELKAAAEEAAAKLEALAETEEN